MSKDVFYVVTTLAVIFISMCALGLTIWQGYLTRKHNKLSVKPIIDSMQDSHGSSFKLSIENHGLGVALVSDIKYFLKETEVSKTDFGLAFNEIISKIGGQNGKMGTFDISKDNLFPLKAGSDFTLLEADISLEAELVSQCRNLFMNHFTFEVDYTCLYGEKYNYQSSSKRF